MLLAMGAAAAAMMMQGYGGGYGGGYGPGPGGPGQGSNPLPGGSYSRSCQNAYVTQGRLYAECSDRSRRLRWSSIPLQRCAGYPIENNDGLLQCGQVRGEFGQGRPGPGGPGGPGRPGGPGGGWGGRSSITVFMDSEFRGRQQTFTGEVRNLGPTGFNDAITSLQVQGVWEVCTDPDFRGRCQVYDYDESNISTFRMNDQVSSLRPLRR